MKTTHRFYRRWIRTRSRPVAPSIPKLLCSGIPGVAHIRREDSRGKLRDEKRRGRRRKNERTKQLARATARSGVASCNIDGRGQGQGITNQEGDDRREPEMAQTLEKGRRRRSSKRPVDMAACKAKKGVVRGKGP